jgi:peptidoglycan-associated lipoprotein
MSRLVWVGALVGAIALSACASKRPTLAGPAAPEAPPTAEAPPAGSPPVTASAVPPPGYASLQAEFAAIAGDRVFFDLDSSSVRGDAAAILDQQAEWLRARPAVMVMVAGNCDERGTREYNLALGARRAQAVLDHLARRGVPAGRIRTISYGKERPIDPGASEEAWARNRNAHTMIQG